MKMSKGTEPSGRHPPLIRQPLAPSSLSLTHKSKSSSGKRAGCMVSNTLPPQCLQLRAQEVPVTDTVGKSLIDEQKCFVL
jgi:hypothetical protein